MEKGTLYSELVKVLREESKFCTEDGELIKNSIIEASLSLDPDLIKLLINSDKLKENFFKKIDKVIIFDYLKFQNFVSNKQFLPDSYTSFKNRIGLVNENNEFISDSREVVLAWPYKDCILEGGQTKDDAKRNEVFWNEILAPKEVNRLTEPKVFTNFLKFDELGEHQVTNITAEDNFIIKGNNLLALYSLAKIYSNGINFIYIDPPYNTGSDSFKYNDSFNQSSWLTFMKNRLDVANRLLNNDGIICVQCSFHEFAYLKLVMDEIFPKHLCTFNIEVRHPDRILTGDKEYNDVIEYTLIYSKNPNAKMPKQQVLKDDTDYIYKFEETGEPEITNFGNKEVEVYTPDKYQVTIEEPNEHLTKKISVRGSIREKNSSGRLYVKFIEPIASNYPPETIFKVKDMGDDDLGYRLFYTAPYGKKNGGYYQGKPTSSDVTNKPYPDFFNFSEEYNNVRSEGGVDFRNGKKPEKYISFLLSIFTKENDLVLDYHLGSGTTAAVAHKMRRRYIGIEQMDYIKTLAVQRLNNVIQGEQTGISKEIAWKGGGSFIYCELARANQIYVDRILKANDNQTIGDIWEDIKNSGYLSWKIDIKAIDENANAFNELSLDDKKKFLIESLDKNMLYIPYSEISSSEFSINENEIMLNKQFYSIK